jgi:uncharacterized protein (DUF1501 family)
MERRDFLRNTTLASLGLSFTLNGFAADFFNTSPFPILNCSDVNDRVLVILRMAGANDGLNMCVPLNYYTEYANLRPTIKLKNIGQTNGIIQLDSTVPDNKKVGLHPSLSGIKNLYDSGKAQLINGVGYANTNQSHFVSENIMWAGKDGNFSGLLDEGLIGNYINSIYPNLSGNPTGFMSDPLCLHLGSVNPILSFAHNHGNDSVEYNAAFLQNSFNSILGKAAPTPLTSDYTTKQNYIKGIEQNMDVYFNRVTTCFSNGVNSNVSYPNTSIAKQLKTIARLIKGGSKTKIFQCTIDGFDTHVQQVVSGNAHLGHHNNLLSAVSGAIFAFQQDITALGFSNKVLTTTFSEFGRKPMENGGLGTDHGNFSPMWVFGDAVDAGILGTNLNLNNVTAAPDGRYFESERQFDYRQVYTTIFQDWLGSENTVLNNIGLSSFVSQKINLIKTAQNASPNCLSSTINIICNDFNSVSSQILVLKTIDAGWEYYGFVDSPAYIIGIEKFPTGANANSANFEIDFDYNTLDCAPNNLGCFKKTNNQEGIFASNDFFNMKVISPIKPNGWVNIRWFTPNNMIQNLNSAALDFKNSANSNYLSPLLWLKKTNSQMKLIDHLRDDAIGLFYAVEKITISSSSSVNGYAYHQFNTINNINGTGIAAIVRVSNIIENNSLYNIPAPVPSRKGSIRFNPISKTFEGYNGSDWLPLH